MNAYGHLRSITRQEWHDSNKARLHETGNGRGKASPKSVVAAVRKAECIYLRSKKIVVTPLRRHVRHEGAACVMSKHILFLFFFQSRCLPPPFIPLLPSGKRPKSRGSRIRLAVRTTRRQIHRDRLSRGFTNTTARANTLLFFSPLPFLIIKNFVRLLTAR